MRIAYKILIGLGLAVLLFGAANWPYFRAQTLYYLNPPQPQPEQKAEDKTEPNKLWIPSLGIEAPIIFPKEETEPAFQQALQNGVAHYPGTALPGQNGNVYIFGHSSDFAAAKGDYKTVFALLPKIEENAAVEISDHEGQLYKYRVASKFVAGARDLHLLEQDYGEKKLTLQTSYPIGTALQRYIVVAYMVE